jgi:hypothetical protein
MARRKRLLSTASAGGSSFSIKEDDWPTIEAYGYQFSRKERDEIQSVTGEFVYWASLEARAKPESEARDCVLVWKRAAENFDRTLYGQPEGDARWDAKGRVATHFTDRRFRRTDLFQDLSTVLSDFIGACSQALKEYEASDDAADHGFCVGESWERWVRDLTRVLKKNGFPTYVRSDDLGFKSPFTMLVLSLQELVPAELRRPCSSELAMGKAIQRARKVRDK